MRSLMQKERLLLTRDREIVRPTMEWNTNRDLHMPYSRVSFQIT